MATPQSHLKRPGLPQGTAHQAQLAAGKLTVDIDRAPTVHRSLGFNGSNRGIRADVTTDCAGQALVFNQAVYVPVFDKV